MRLHHKVPCRECPWRKESAAGYLGGWPAEHYADAVQANEIPACHLRDHGPENKDTAFCVGALATSANACILPDKQPGAKEARKEVGRREDCFGHPREFYQHHTGQEYVLRIFRKRSAP